MNTIALLCLAVLVFCPVATTDYRLCCSIAANDPNASNDYMSGDSWYKESLPINILGNDDFADQASANSWEGNGSITNPYIIEGVNVTVTGISPIQIVNTTVFFEVRGCLAVGGPTGILLQNVTNARIWNNTIQSSVSCGLQVTESIGVVIINNTIHSISDAASQGIYSFASEHCQFSNNTVQSINGWGILADYTHNCSIALNRVDDCTRDGIGLRDSSENNITLNEVAHSDMCGIRLGNSHRCKLEQNLVGHSLSDGISIEASADCVVQGNVLYESGGQSLDVAGDSTDIIANTFYRSQIQSLRCQSDNNYVSHNNFIENSLESSLFLPFIDITGTDSIIIGNYYDVWTWPDEDDDGIVDSSFQYGGSTDERDSEPHVRVFQTDLMHILTRPILIYPNETLSGENFWGPIQLRWGVASDTSEHDVTYNVSISIDGGSSWNKIAHGLNETLLVWNSSEFLESAEYRFRVTAQCTEGLISEYITNAEYEVKSHTLSVPTVLTPNGGETIIEGTAITWDESVESWDLQVRYDVYYSADAGETWNEVFLDVDGPDVHWDVRALSVGGEYLVRVVARSSSGLVAEDVSDSVFSIASRDYSTIILAGVGGAIVLVAVILIYAHLRRGGA